MSISCNIKCKKHAIKGFMTQSLKIKSTEKRVVW